MANDQGVPTYAYGPETTLGGLFNAYLTMTDTKAAALAKRLGLYESTVQQWVDGNPSNSLTSSHRAKVEQATGIDLDRWMVVEAKRALVAQRPDLTDKIRFDRFLTRREIVEELARYAKMYGGARYLAAQMGLDEKTVGPWILGLTKGKRGCMPQDDLLRTALLAAVTGLIEGNRNDVLVRLLARDLFGRDLPEVFPGATGIVSFTLMFLKMYQGMTTSEIERASGIQRNTIKLLYDIAKNPGARLYEATVSRMFRALVQKRMPERLDAFDAAAKQYAEDKPVTTPVPAAKAAPANVPAPLAATPPAPDGRLDRIESDLSDVKRTVEKIAAAKSFAEQFGETLNGVEHCLSTTHFGAVPGQCLSDAQVKKLMDGFTHLRKALVMVNSLDGSQKRSVLDLIAPQFDELVLAVKTLKFWDVIGSKTLIDAQRDSIALARKKG